MQTTQETYLYVYDLSQMRQSESVLALGNVVSFLHFYMTAVFSDFRLQFLRIDRIYGLSDGALLPVAENLNQLEFLSIEGCWRISDRTLIQIAEYCKKLKVVRAKNCRDISMACLRMLSAKGIDVDKHIWISFHDRKPKGLNV